MKRVITYGTFDLFHIGHQRILERAKALGDYLVVAVTSEQYDIERGKLNVRDNLSTRIENVRNTGLADEIIVEEYLGQKISDIAKYSIDVLVVGSDWVGKFDYLKEYCEVLYLDRTKGISSTQIRENNEKIYKLSIITDTDMDNDITAESNFVSGLELIGVYSHDNKLAENFRKKYDIGRRFDTLEKIFEASDIVYIHVKDDQKNNYTKQAILHGIHVITDFPILETQNMKELFTLADEKGIVLCERVFLAYISTFHRLIGLISTGIIGDILSIDCTMPGASNFTETVTIPLFVFGKLLGNLYKKIERISVSSEGTEIDKIILSYPNAYATASISSSPWSKSEMVIIGTKGKINVPDKWWYMSYFRAEISGMDDKIRHSFNMEGTGFRYLLLDVLLRIKDERIDTSGFTREDASLVMELIDSI